MPTPAPQPEEIESVREIALLSSYTLTASLIDKLQDATWASLKAMVADEWPDIRHDDVVIQGRVRVDPASTRMLFTRDVRLMLGLPPYPEMDYMVAWFNNSGPSRTEVLW